MVEYVLHLLNRHLVIILSARRVLESWKRFTAWLSAFWDAKRQTYTKLSNSIALVTFRQYHFFVSFMLVVWVVVNQRAHLQSGCVSKSYFVQLSVPNCEQSTRNGWTDTIKLSFSSNFRKTLICSKRKPQMDKDRLILKIRV